MGEQIRVTPTLRVESGPPRKTAIATKAMQPDLDERGRVTVDAQEKRAKLSDGTVLAKHYKLGLKDALGKVIVEGQEFTYLDYFGPEVWYFYQLEDVPLEDDMLARMANAISVRTGTPVLPADLTAELIADWYGVSTAWVTQNAAGRWQFKRFMPRSVHQTKDEALAAADALKE